MRFFIEISYKGSSYHGWQIQPNANTIQGEINNALTTILKNKIDVVGAGRTDTGVHATQMFAHFDFKDNLEIQELILKLNGFLPEDIVIHNIYKVSHTAHARFDAISRTYDYHIIQKKDPFIKHAYFLYQDINIDAMNQASQYLLGHHDFTSFAKVNSETHTNNCEIMKAIWSRKEKQIIFTIKANRFLRNMVRAIVGTLLEIGKEKMSPDILKQIIYNKNRNSAGPSVPACGLFLKNIDYPKDIFNE